MLILAFSYSKFVSFYSSMPNNMSFSPCSHILKLKILKFLNLTQFQIFNFYHSYFPSMATPSPISHGLLFVHATISLYIRRNGVHEQDSICFGKILYVSTIGFIMYTNVIYSARCFVCFKHGEQVSVRSQ